jgi:predicted lipid-binding transport protein (Tim44 family)
MKKLTRDEIERLTPEQQNALGALEVKRVEARQRLIESARGYGGTGLVAGLMIGAAMALVFYGIFEPRAVPLAIIPVITLIGFHAAGINRRLDALTELLKKDLSLPADLRPHGGAPGRLSAPASGPLMQTSAS